MQVPYRKPGKMMHLQTDPLITRDKFVQLQRELQRLMKLRPQVATEVNRLAQNGDFSENAEYQMAKGRLRGINDAIDRLHYQIDHSEIIETSPRTTVQIGHTVVVESHGVKRIYTILGSSETNPATGVISHNSPLGVVLIGCSVGQTVKLKLPNREIEYTIIEIK